MATTAHGGGVVNIGPTHRNIHEDSGLVDEDGSYARMQGSGELSSEAYHHQSNSPGVLMTAVRSVKSEVSPASPDSTMSSSSSTTTEDSHVSVLRRGPSAAPPFVPFTAPPARIQSGTPGGTGNFRLHHHHQPASVARRNARERNRVKQVNNGFATLRQHIPPALIAAAASERSASPSERSSGRCSSSSAASKKMSKVETLRCAVEYIRSLQDLLIEADGESPECQVEVKKETDVQGTSPAVAAGPSPASSPISSPGSSSAFLPPSPAPSSSTEPIQDGSRQYLPLQPVQAFDYIDIDTYARLQNYGSDGTNGVLQFYHERVKREEMEDVMVMEPPPGVVASTISPPPLGYSTSATAYLAMAPGPALIQRQLGAGDDVELVESDMAGMMTWWAEGPQC